MKKLIIALLCTFALSAVAFAEEAAKTDAPKDMSAEKTEKVEQSHSAITGKTTTKKTKKMKRKHADGKKHEDSTTTTTKAADDGSKTTTTTEEKHD